MRVNLLEKPLLRALRDAQCSMINAQCPRIAVIVLMGKMDMFRGHVGLKENLRGSSAKVMSCFFVCPLDKVYKGH